MAKLHKHLIVHAAVDKPPVKKDERFVEQWLTDIVHSMGMEVLKEASAEYCEQVGNRGMTAVVLITTSHMVLHTWDECDQPFIEFDLYTCSELDPEMAFKALEAFGAKNISYKFLDRYDGLTDLTPVPMTRVVNRPKLTFWQRVKGVFNPSALNISQS